MAILKISVPRDDAWLNTDHVELWIGSENAASLAASTPAGGTKVSEQLAWPRGTERGGWGSGIWGEGIWGFFANPFAWGEGVWGYGAWGMSFAGPLEFQHRYAPADICATLPVGVTVVDASGNRSTVVETLLQLADTPVGARDLAVAATANPNEAMLSWTASPDV